MIGRADIEGSKKKRRYERLACHEPVYPWYGRRHENYHYLHGFSRANKRRTGHRKRRGALRETASLSRYEPIPGTRNSYKEKITLPRVLRDVPSAVALTALGPEGPISVSGLGHINPIPFPVGSETNTALCLQFRQTFSLRNGFLRSLRTGTDPC
ncbi:hypothetical protein JTE90_019628 [Oedothorax gibbosus]|uniref:Uncharacterized protein n=1 Tax=Oedothorax gibbosus TaxID=931172 RepID=A0AAV6TH64_9ARAC|nr:hypothetical protein JTE90_019628 [Oedothorax gibbosus]